MDARWRNRWLKAGLLIALVGWSPLLGILVLAGIGLWPDPNPNPVGPGLLFFVTAWPAVFCFAVGAIKALRTPPTRVPSSGSPSGTATTSRRSVPSVPSAVLRVGAGAGGCFLAVYGINHLRDSQSARGAASAIVIGGVLIYWAITATWPRWRRN